MGLRKRNKLVYGVGTNDADYNIIEYDGSHQIVQRCPYYTKWVAMLARGYSELLHKKHPSYAGVSVCEEWLTFSNFKSWMETQDWEGKHLDKDILVKGNKLYSPDTCIFVSQEINKFLTESTVARGNYPIGVSLEKKSLKFKAQCYNVQSGKKEYLGLFDSPVDAHRAWLCFKLKQAKFLAEKQKDNRVANALVYFYENY